MVLLERLSGSGACLARRGVGRAGSACLAAAGGAGAPKAQSRPGNQRRAADRQELQNSSTSRRRDRGPTEADRAAGGQHEELKKQPSRCSNLDALTASLKAVRPSAAAASKTELEARLMKIEGSLKDKPEVLDVVSAGDFPGSFTIPGTDTAMKIGGLVWTSLVQTFSALGSDTQFLTWSIPAEGTPEAGQGPRLSVWAAPSRFNFDVRTPTEVGGMRAFIEGDFAGANNGFRLRHAYGQFGRVLVGQTWSTFSDPNADFEGIDFEGVNAENVTRQAQIRYHAAPKGPPVAVL
jgi:hypothetical protein